MARFRHPTTVGLPTEAWPPADRAAWELACRAGDVLTGAGPASRWTPKTRRSVSKAYGIWLRFLVDRGRLAAGSRGSAQLTESNLGDYIAHLRRRSSPHTVLGRLRNLSSAVAVMDSSADRALIKLALSRLSRLARPVRNKLARLQSPSALLDLGLSLMTNWQDRTAHDPRLNAMDYRDGLMIAFLALCPIRLGNLAAMVVGQHLSFVSGAPRVVFAAREMKGKRALDVDFPAELRPALNLYLERIHPMLHAGTTVGSPLWPSLHRTQMTEHGIYTRIVQITEAHFGQPVTPHMFRDAAATAIAEMTPEHAMMAATVLQHTSLQTTLKHYIHGQQHLAARKYHAAIDELIASVATEPFDLDQE